MNLTVVVPFWNGHDTIERLMGSLPSGVQVFIIDDLSDKPLIFTGSNVKAVRMKERGYFTGAVNYGISLRKPGNDVLILNQDTWFESSDWLNFLEENRKTYGLIGEGIAGNHPAWPKGYIHGTFMFIRSDVIDALDPMDEKNYPLWGSTCEYQLRACRKGFKALPIPQGEVPGFRHAREKGYGSAITEALRREPDKRGLMIRTPPLVSVIVPTYNHGIFLPDLISSLIGGPSCLGDQSGQTLQSFDIFIVDDGSTDQTAQIAQTLADPWKGIHYIYKENGGTPSANNVGIRSSRGKFISVVCADDMMTPDRLERLYRVAQRYDHHLLYDDLQTFQDGALGKVWKMPEYDFETLLIKNHVHAGIMFPRKAWEEIGGYPEEMREGREDWAFAVAAGIVGYCGHHVEGAGYLYRREGQNRTLRNTTPRWRRRFLNQLRALFPQIYNGERPMACCGGKKRAARRPASRRAGASMTATNLAGLPGQEGMTRIQYVGSNEGTETWFGKGARRYKFGRSSPVGYVDNRDVDDFLTRRERGRLLFRLYEEPKVVDLSPLPTPDATLPDRTEIHSFVDVGDFSIAELKEGVAAGTWDRDTLTSMLQQEEGRSKPRVTALKIFRGALDD